LPLNWEIKLKYNIKELENNKIKWAVLGIYGVSDDYKMCGRTWSSGMRKELGGYFKYPKKAISLDEHVLVFNKDTRIGFDNKLPGYHLYGTDIVQTALINGYECFVIHAPVIHNSRPIMMLEKTYIKAYNYMKYKWKSKLPMKTCVLPITRYSIKLKITYFKKWVKYKLLKKNSNQKRLSSLEKLAIKLDYV
jgi:hypothetical protein